jgi:hypothetical protein
VVNAVLRLQNFKQARKTQDLRGQLFGRTVGAWSSGFGSPQRLFCGRGKMVSCLLNTLVGMVAFTVDRIAARLIAMDDVCSLTDGRWELT